jgi:hypothetical protein
LRKPRLPVLPARVSVPGFSNARTDPGSRSSACISCGHVRPSRIYQAKYFKYKKLPSNLSIELSSDYNLKLGKCSLAGARPTVVSRVCFWEIRWNTDVSSIRRSRGAAPRRRLEHAQYTAKTNCCSPTCFALTAVTSASRYNFATSEASRRRTSAAYSCLMRYDTAALQ